MAARRKSPARRNPVTGELFEDQKARALSLRGKLISLGRIAAELHVSPQCVHRWVKGTPEDAAACKAPQFRPDTYPPGYSNYRRKLQTAGFSRPERLQLIRELAARESRGRA